MERATLHSGFIEQINQKIEPAILLEKIAYFPEKARTIAGDIKCLCPIHRDELFKSLIINVRKKTYKCTLRKCSGYKGGDLVDLYAKFRGLARLIAACELIKELELEVPPELTIALAEDFFQQAKTAEETNNLEGAHQLILHAIDIQPFNPHYCFYLGSILEKKEEIAEALINYQKAALLYKDSSQWEQAQEIFKSIILRLDPENTEALTQLALISEHLGNTEQTVQYYLRLAHLYEANQEEAKNIDIYLRILTIDPKQMGVRRSLAELHQRQGNNEEAIAQFWEVYKFHREESDTHQAVATLSRLEELGAAKTQVLEELALIHLELGEKQQAEQELLKLAHLWLEQNLPDQAQLAIDKILAFNLKCVEARTFEADILVQKDRAAEAVGKLLELVQLLDKKEDTEQILKILNKARDIDSENIQVLEAIFAFYLDQQELPDAIKQGIDLIERYLKDSRAEKAEEIRLRIAQASPLDLPVNLRVAELFEKHNQAEIARTHYLELAQRLLEAEKPKETLEACDAFLNQMPDDIQALSLKISALLKIDDIEQAATALQKLFTAYQRDQNWAEAEATLKQLVQLQPQNIFALDKLAEVYIIQDKKPLALDTLKELLIVYEEQQNGEQVINTCQRILEIDPELIDIILTRADHYLQRSEKAAAITDYSRAVDIFLSRDLYANAQECLERILEIEPQAYKYARLLAEVVFKKDGANKAKELFANALDLLSESAPLDQIRKEYENIVQLDTAFQDLRMALAQLLFRRGEAKKATAELQTLISYYIDSHELPKALQAADVLIEHNPQDTSPLIKKAEILLRSGETAQAITVYQQAANLYQQQEELDKAKQILEKIITHAPEDETALENLARLAERENNVEKAIDYLNQVVSKRAKEARAKENIPLLEKIIQLDNSQLTAKQTLAQLYEEDDKLDLALEHYLDLAQTLCAQEKAAEAIPILEHAYEAKSDNTSVLELLADSYVKCGESVKALESFKTLYDLALKDNNLEGAFKYLTQASQIAPEDVELSRSLAKLLEDKGEIEQATQEYLRLSDLLEKQEDLDNALDALNKAKDLAPERIDIHERVASLNLTLSRLEVAFNEYGEIIQLYFRSENVENALKTYEKAKEIFFEQPAYLLDLIQLLVINNQVALALDECKSFLALALEEARYEQGVRCSRLGLSLKSDDISLHEMLIQCLVALGQNQEAINEYNFLISICINNDELPQAIKYINAALQILPDNLELLYKLVDCFMRSEQINQAVETYSRIASLQEESNQPETAINTYLKALELDENNIGLRQELSRLYLQTEDLDNAIKQYNRVADLQLQNEDYTAAQSTLTRILELNPDHAPTYHKLGHLTYKEEGIQAARDYFENYLRLIQTQLPVQQVVEEYKQMLEIDPENIALHINFARLLKDASQTAQAKEEFVRIAQLFESKEDDIQSAINYLQEALSLAPEDTELMLRLAELNQRTGSTAEAYNYYRTAAEIFLNGNQPERALTLYEQASSLQPENEELLLQITELQQQLELNQQAIDTYLKIAQIRESQARSSENIPVFMRILELAPELKEMRQRLIDIFTKENLNDDAAFHSLMLARQYEEENDFLQAIKIYQNIKTLSPQEQTNRRHLIEIYLKMEEEKKAIEELEELGAIYIELGNSKEAEHCFQQLLELDPANVRTAERLAKLYEAEHRIEEACREYLKLSSIYTKGGDNERAIETLEHIKSLDKENLEARRQLFHLLWQHWPERAKADGLELAQLLLEKNDEEQASNIFAKLTELFPDELSLYQQIIQLWLQFDRLDRAEAAYIKASDYFLQINKADEVLELCQAGLEKFPENLSLLQLKISALENLNRIEEAVEVLFSLASIHAKQTNANEQERCLHKVISLKADFIEARQALATLLISQERYSEAIEQLYQLVNYFARSEAPDKAAEQLNMILSLDPHQIDARQQLSQIYISIGKNELAIEQLLKIAEHYISEDQLVVAKEVLEKILSLQSYHTKALDRLCHIALKLEDQASFIEYAHRLADGYQKVSALNEAAQTCEKILQLDAGNRQAQEKLLSLYEQLEEVDKFIKLSFTLADQFEAQDDYESSLHYLLKIENYQPDDPDNLHRIAKLYANLDNQAKARAYLQKVTAILEERDELDKTIAVIKELIEGESENPEYRAKLAQLLEKQGKNQDAAAELMVVASIYQELDKTDLAISALEKLIALDPSNLEGRDTLASLFNKVGEKEKAIEQYLHLAQAYEEMGAYVKAVKVGQTVLTMTADNFAAHERLFDLHRNLGDHQDALNEAEWLSDYYINSQNYPAAEKILNQGLELDPKHISSYSRLAKIYLAQDKPELAATNQLKVAQLYLEANASDEAINAFEEALSLIPENTAVHQNLYQLYRGQGNFDKAAEELITLIHLSLEQGITEVIEELERDLLEIKPDDLDTINRLIEIYLKFDLPEQACRHYLHMAETERARDNLPPAIDSLNKALELQPSNVTAYLRLAEIYAAQGDRQRSINTSLKLVKILESEGKCDEAIDCLQDLLKSQPDSIKARQRLIKIYENLNRTDELIAELQQLADLYARKEQIEKAIPLYKKILKLKPDDITARSKYIELYSEVGTDEELVEEYLILAELYNKNGAFVEAGHALEKVLKLSPENSKALELYISFLLNTGQYQQALDKIKQLCSIYVEQGQQRSAISLLEQAMENMPDFIQIRMQLADLYLHNNARGKALQLLEETAEKFANIENKETLANIFERIIELQPYAPQYYDKLIELFILLDERKKAVEYAHRLADIYLQQSFFDLAEEVYRRIVSLAPQDFAAWQNLFDTHLQVGTEEELFDDYCKLAEIYYEQGEIQQSLDIYKKALNIRPQDIELRRKYIDAYLQVGVETDLIDFYLELADLLAQANQIDEAANYYERILAIAPQDHKAYKRASETTLYKTKQPEVSAEAQEEESYEDIINNYLNILHINPNNAIVRCKLADIYDKLDQADKAYQERKLASTIFIKKGQLEKGIAICEKLMEQNPSDQEIRQILSQAVLQRDSFKAIESAIQFLEKDKEAEQDLDSPL